MSTQLTDDNDNTDAPFLTKTLIFRLIYIYFGLTHGLKGKNSIVIALILSIASPAEV
jgi:hypothetical protein